MFWQGGFTFYAAVVVPVGTQVLGSALDQGWITRSVTFWLNLAGAAALTAWVWDIAVQADAPSHRRRRFVLWSALALLLVALFILRGRLDALMDADAQRILERGTFRSWHRGYLILSTVQWAGSML